MSVSDDSLTPRVNAKMQISITQAFNQPSPHVISCNDKESNALPRVKNHDKTVEEPITMNSLLENSTLPKNVRFHKQQLRRLLHQESSS